MSNRLDDLLTGAIPPGVYRFSSRASAAALAHRAERRGWRLFHLQGSEIASKGDFLQACARAMSFPSYFGNNWDALEDCLRDLAWAPTQSGYLVLYDHAGRLASADPPDFAVALDILHTATENWRNTSTPMIVLLRGMGRTGAQTPVV